MRKKLSRWIVVGLLGLVGPLGCDDTVPPLDSPLPCICGDSGDGCDVAYCSYVLSLEPNCQGEVSRAEVLMDGHLESEVLTFEVVDGSVEPSVMVPCTRTAPGETTRIDVFAGKWAWSRTGNLCDVDGEVKEILFGCTTE